MKVSRAGQLTYFAAIPIPTTDKGMYFLFYAVDAFSKETYNLGMEQKLNEESLFGKIGALLDDEKFKTHTGKAFKVMFPIGEEIAERFNTFLGRKGKAVFNYEATNKVAEVLVEQGILGKINK